MRRTLALLATALALAAIGWWGVPRARRTFIRALVTYDATPTEPVALPTGTGPGLDRTARTRVVLVDGLSADAAAQLPRWTALCDRGTRLTVDVGFPTVSLPVEVALWTGLTQQQTGIVFRADRPLAVPVPGIPQQISGSIAIAESHGYLVRSLGFARALPAATTNDPARDADPDTWDGIWRALAHESVASAAPLVFVHVLRVDVAGHKAGGASPAYLAAAREADAILDELVGAAPDARWFALSDHGHLATGGHGGDERAVRQVSGCIAGPGVAHTTGATVVHVVDVARAIADSTGAQLAARSPGRPLAAALAAPLVDDQAVPPLAPGPLAIGAALLGLGLVATGLAVRRSRWLAPIWYPIALALLVAVRGAPTLSMPMVYQGSAELMTLAWLPALGGLAIAAGLALRRASLGRVLVAQLALPVATAAAAITACGGWDAIAGGASAPIVPHVTAWCSPLVAVVGQALLAVALAALATAGRQAFDRRGRPETSRSAS